MRNLTNAELRERLESESDAPRWLLISPVLAERDLFDILLNVQDTDKDGLEWLSDLFRLFTAHPDLLGDDHAAFVAYYVPMFKRIQAATYELSELCGLIYQAPTYATPIAVWMARADLNRDLRMAWVNNTRHWLLKQNFLD